MTRVLHPDGVYFGLPEEEYHADPALGSTDLKRLLISASDYWWHSQWNPLRKDEDTPARARGRAFHNLILLGREEFDRRFVRGLVKEEHPDALITHDQLKAAAKEHDVEIKGLKGELVARLQERVPKLKIWDVMVAELEAQGKTILPAETFDEALVAGKMITGNPSLAKAFQGGMPEVSVFWTHDGVRMKCRFDYLKLRAISDLKTFTNTLNQPVEKAIIRSIANYRYDIQGSHYLTGRWRLRELVEDGRIFGDVDTQWLARCAQEDQFTFVFVFSEVGGAPVARGYQYDRGTNMDAGATTEIEFAISRFKEYRERYGMESVWVDQTDIHVLVPGDFPSWMGM